MNQSPFHRLLLPSALAFSISFSVVTSFLLPRILHIVSLRPVDTDTHYRLIDGSQRATSRYVGLAIIAGAISGLMTFEGLRRWYQYRNAAHVKAEELGLLSFLQEPASDSLPQELDIPLLSPDPTSLLMAHRDDGYQQIVLPRVTPSQERGISTVNIPVLTSRHHYQICRIQQPDLGRQWLGLTVGDRSYRFVRTETTREAAMKKANRYQKDGQSAMITATQRGYAVWIMEHDSAASQPK